MKVLTDAVNPAYIHESHVEGVDRIEGDIILRVRQQGSHGATQPSIVFSLSEARMLLARLKELIDP